MRLKVAKIHGSIMLPAIIVMIIISYASLTLVQLQSTSLIEASNHVYKTYSQDIALGGLEFALTQISDGKSPVTGSMKTLGSGEFEVTANPATGIVTVIGQKNKSTKEYTIQTKFAKDCIELKDNYTFNMGDTIGELQSVQYKKNCMNKLVFKKIRISWQDSLLSQKFKKIVENTTVYYDAFIFPATGAPNGGTNSGETIDINDISVADDSTHTFNFFRMEYSLGQAPHHATTFTITYYFADGSSISKDYIYN